MKNRLRWMAFGLLAALSTPPLQASPNTHPMFAELLKTSINRMVQDVRQAREPDAKREILDRYLSRIHHGLEKIAINPSLTKSDREAVNGLKAGFQANYSELNGLGGFPGVTDSDLNAFAGFVQQNQEQADWGTGGVFVSTGVLLILIVMLILLT